MEKLGYVNLFTEIAMQMNELIVPMGGWFCVFPPFVLRGLTHSIIAAGQPNERPIAEAFVTRISGLYVIVSNNLLAETNGDTRIWARRKGGGNAHSTAHENRGTVRPRFFQRLGTGLGGLYYGTFTSWTCNRTD
jgi:hypothetical protein